MFSITPLPEPGRYLVQIDGVGVTWTTYARDLADCEAILDRQRSAWTRRLANVKLRRGEALKRRISREYAARRTAT